MKLKQITFPAVEPVTIAEIKRQLRLDETRGEPAPLSLTATVTGSTVPNVTAGAHRYRVTYKTATGETDGGLISSLVTTSSTATVVTLTGIPTGGDLVTGRNVYRTAAGGSTYLKVVTLSNNSTSTYTDMVPDGSLGVQCPITNTTDDPEILDFIQTAREACETEANRAFINQTFELRLNGFPRATINGLMPNPHPVIFLPRGTVQSLDFVKYYDMDGVLQTASTGYFQVSDGDVPNYITPAIDSTTNVRNTWPDTQNRTDAVIVRFTVGYGAAASDVPGKIKTAIRMFVNHLYENRGLTGPQQMDTPNGALKFLYDEKVHWRGGENEGL